VRTSYCTSPTTVATFDFSDKAIIELSAPKVGPYAGVLLMENTQARLGKNYSIAAQR
jgi:hypothetical protein